MQLRRQVTRQHQIFIVHQGHGIFGRHFGRHTKAQQPVDGVFAHDDAVKFALVIERHLQLQRGRVVAIGLFGNQRAGVNRLAQVPRQFIGAICLANLELVACSAPLAGIGAGRYVGDLDAPFAVHPAHRHQLRVLIDQRFGLDNELLCIHFLVGDIPTNTHELFLPFKQAQAQPLLGVFHIASDGLLLAFYLLNAQIAESRNHSRQKKHHGQ